MISDYVFKRTNALLQRGCVNQNGIGSKISLQMKEIEKKFEERNKGSLLVQDKRNSTLIEEKRRQDLNESSHFDNNMQEEVTQIEQKCRIDRSIFSGVEVIGNSYAKAIICFNNQNGILFGLDQHAIHERLRYEYFCFLFKQTIYDKYSNQISKINSTCINLSHKNDKIEFPSVISYDASSTISLEADLQCAQKIIKCRSLADNYKINIVKVIQIAEDKFTIYLWPQMLILNEPVQYNIQFLNQITSSEFNEIPTEIDHILMYKACKGAIKFNEILNQQQMDTLLTNLQHCEFPFHCVHGRCSIHPFFCLETQQICQIQKQYTL